MPKRSARALLAAIVIPLLAAAGAVAAVPTSASAATSTYMALHLQSSPALAGTPVVIQLYTGSLAGNFPPGDAEVMVEGSGMREGASVSTSDGGAQIKIGNFPAGTITVDGSFTPSDSSTYATTTTKASFTINPVGDSVRPAFLTTPSLGHSVSAVALLFLGSGAPHAPGGVVSFLIGGKSVGTCTPAPTEAVANYSCKATLPAPTAAGKYTVTAQFGRSQYYSDSSASVSASIAAAKSAPKTSTKSSSSSSSSSSGATSSTTTGSTPAPTSAPTSAPSSAPEPIAADKTDVQKTTSTQTDPWAWLFVATLVLLIAGGVVAIVALRRKRA